MLGLGTLAVSAPPMSHPMLLWNASSSVPVGLYRLEARAPVMGELAAIRLPEPVRSLAAKRGYLGARALLIKPVAGGAGDVVCRHSAIVTINGHLVALARTFDVAGRVLPSWSGCRVLAGAEVFVLSAVPDSFDSRYFGPIDQANVLGVGHPVWTGG